MASGTATGLAQGTFVAAAFTLPSLLMYSNKAMVVVLATLATACLPAALRGERRLTAGERACLAAAACFLAWGGLSALWAEVPGLPFPKLFQLLGLAVLGWITLRAGRTLNEGGRRRIVVALVAGFMLAAAAAVIEAATGLGLTRTLRPLLTGVPWEPGMIELSAFKNLGSAGAVLAVAAAAAAALRRQALLGVACLLAIATVTVVTRNHTGAAALLAALAVILAGRRLAPLAVGAGVACLAALVPFAHLIPHSAQLAQALPWLPNSLIHRSAIWQFAAERAWERPFLGWGLDGSRELPGGDADIMLWVFDNQKLAGYATQVLPLHPHNFLLQVWLELGFVGLGLWLLVLALLIGNIMRLPRQAPRVGSAVLAAAIIVATASFSLWQSWWVATLWLAASLTLAMLPGKPPLEPRGGPTYSE